MLLSDCVIGASLLVTVFAQKWIGPAATTAPVSVTHTVSSSGAQATPWLPNQHKQILPRASSSVSSINSICGFLQVEGGNNTEWGCSEGELCAYDYGLKSKLCCDATTGQCGATPPTCMGLSQFPELKTCNETCADELFASGQFLCIQPEKPICNRMTFLSEGLYDWNCDSTSTWQTILPISSPVVMNLSITTATGPTVDPVTSESLKVSITGATTAAQPSDVPFKVPVGVATTTAKSLGVSVTIRVEPLATSALGVFWLLILSTMF